MGVKIPNSIQEPPIDPPEHGLPLCVECEGEFADLDENGHCEDCANERRG